MEEGVEEKKRSKYYHLELKSPTIRMFCMKLLSVVTSDLSLLVLGIDSDFLDLYCKPIAVQCGLFLSYKICLKQCNSISQNK